MQLVILMIRILIVHFVCIVEMIRVLHTCQHFRFSRNCSVFLVLKSPKIGTFRFFKNIEKENINTKEIMSKTKIVADAVD